jgi:hypothetical protein
MQTPLIDNDHPAALVMAWTVGVCLTASVVCLWMWAMIHLRVKRLWHMIGGDLCQQVTVTTGVSPQFPSLFRNVACFMEINGVPRRPIKSVSGGAASAGSSTTTLLKIAFCQFAVLGTANTFMLLTFLGSYIGERSGCRIWPLRIAVSAVVVQVFWLAFSASMVIKVTFLVVYNVVMLILVTCAAGLHDNWPIFAGLFYVVSSCAVFVVLGIVISRRHRQQGFTALQKQVLVITCLHFLLIVIYTGSNSGTPIDQWAINVADIVFIVWINIVSHRFWKKEEIANACMSMQTSLFEEKESSDEMIWHLIRQQSRHVSPRDLHVGVGDTAQPQDIAPVPVSVPAVQIQFSSDQSSSGLTSMLEDYAL